MSDFPSKEQIIDGLLSRDNQKRAYALTASQFRYLSDHIINHYCMLSLNDECLEVRWAAVLAVAARGLQGVLVPIAEGLRDEDIGFRVACAWALHDLIGSYPDEGVKSFIESENVWIAYISCLMLTQRGNSDIYVLERLNNLCQLDEILSPMKSPSSEVGEIWNAFRWQRRLG
jgi:hypothetical protein